MALNKRFWKKKKVLITGHTGFKGSWMSLYLYTLGAKVYGVSLKEENKHLLYPYLKKKNIFEKSFYYDIRDKKKIKKTIKKIQPNILIHLAAQPLVLESFKNRFFNYETNINGTINILESALNITSLKAIFVATTDKVYKNFDKKTKIFKENDMLGGDDPYSASKVCVEIILNSYFNSFLKFKKISLIIGRAGNVIGGGDWSENRIVPDIFRSVKSKKRILIRNPNHIRPWQHVFEPLRGYLMAIEKNYKKNNYEVYNFGPSIKESISVKKIVKKFNRKINFNFKEFSKKSKKEKETLKLSIDKSIKFLKWRPYLNLDKTINLTIEWYVNYLEKKNIYKKSIEQINKYDRIK